MDTEFEISRLTVRHRLQVHLRKSTPWDRRRCLLWDARFPQSLFVVLPTMVFSDRSWGCSSGSPNTAPLNALQVSETATSYVFVFLDLRASLWDTVFGITVFRVAETCSHSCSPILRLCTPRCSHSPNTDLRSTLPVSISVLPT